MARRTAERPAERGVRRAETNAVAPYLTALRAPMNHDCEVAWVVENDGDDETVNETAILEQQWCQQHLAATATTVEVAP